MRLRSFACSSFGLLALGVNFSYFFRLRMASPCASIVAYALSTPLGAERKRSARRCGLVFWGGLGGPGHRLGQ